MSYRPEAAAARFTPYGRRGDAPDRHSRCGDARCRSTQISPAANGGTVAVRYTDGRSSPATIVGRDVLTDLAVLKATDQASGLPVIATGSSRELVVGEPVVALGAPLGLVDTVTAGIISAMDREVALPAAAGQTAHLVDALQTDAAINPGTSGGALVNCSTELIGVNTAIATVPNAAGEGGGGSVGLGFAIPVDIAMPIAINGQPAVSAEQVTVAELAARSGRTVELAYLRGRTTTTVTLAPVPIQP